MSDANPPVTPAATSATQQPATQQQLGDKRPREEIDASMIVAGGVGGVKPKTFLIRHKKIRSDFALISWMLYDFRDTLGISSWFESKVTLAKTHAVAHHQEGGDDTEVVSAPVPQSSSEGGVGGGAEGGDDNDAVEGGAPKVVAVDVEHESIGVLKPNAPVQCVYVDFSRKPYFLLEWCSVKKGEDGLEGLLQPPADTVKLLETKILELNGKEYKGEPIEVMVALPGATVAAQRAKVVAVHKAAAPANNSNSAGAGGEGVEKTPVAPASTYVAPKKMVPRSMMMKKK